jgi:hypothetical protein
VTRTFVRVSNSKKKSPVEAGLFLFAGVHGRAAVQAIFRTWNKEQRGQVHLSGAVPDLPPLVPSGLELRGRA